jgi:hypothetical protein
LQLSCVYLSTSVGGLGRQVPIHGNFRACNVSTSSLPVYVSTSSLSVCIHQVEYRPSGFRQS